MVLRTKSCHLQNGLTFQDPSELPVKISNSVLAITWEDSRVIECQLTFQVNLKLYQYIDEKTLFNLELELRSPFNKKILLPQFDIEIEVRLKPDLIANYFKSITTIDDANDYFLELNESQPNNPLFITESWFCSSVTQKQESEIVGYTTFWKHLNLSTFAQDNFLNEAISQSIVNFFEDSVPNDLEKVLEQAMSEISQGIIKTFEEPLDHPTGKEFLRDLENLTQSQLLETVINFFITEDWPFVEIEEELSLELSFQGEQGRWACYAKVIEEQQKFIFYSVCPVDVPASKRLAMAEFITRVNYGLILGNFEMDFETGEIRYKTSIDVAGDQLSTALVQQLVYTNVTIMDNFLPGIMAVIYSNISPIEAIAQIEG